MKKKTLLTTLVLGSLVVPTAFGAVIPDVTTTVTANTDGTFTATSKLAEAIHGTTNIYLGGMRDGRPYMPNRNELTPSSIILGTSESGSTTEYLTNRITSGNINMSYNKNGTTMASGMDLTGFQNTKGDKSGTYDYDGVDLTNLDSDGNVMEAKFTLDDGVVQGNENTGSRLTKHELKVFSDDESIRSTITDRTISTANDKYVFSMSGNSVSVINKTIGVDRAYLYNHGLEVRQADGGYVTFGREKVDVGNNTINRVADGVADTDAVNVKQLKDAVAAATGNITDKDTITTVTAGDNITVSNNQNANDSTNYTVSVNKNLTDMSSAVFKDHSSDRSEYEHLSYVPTMSHIDKRGETKIDGSVIQLHSTAPSSEPNQLTTLTGTQLTFTRAGDYMSAYDLNGMFVFNTGQGIVANAGNLEVFGHVDGDDTKPYREMQFSVGNVNMGDQQVHGVAAGTADTDAVNVSQLNQLGSQVSVNTKDIADLKGKIGGTNVLNESKSYTDNKFNAANAYTDQRIAKAGAANAALSGLKYLDYDANHKLSAAASFGQYKGATAGAIGLAYQPNEDVLVHLGATVGSEHMFNGGVSIRVGDTSKGVKANTKNLAKEMDAIKAENAELKAELAEIKAMLANR